MQVACSWLYKRLLSRDLLLQSLAGIRQKSRGWTAASPDDHAAGWCAWYWGDAGAWMRRDFEEGTPGWMRKGPAAYLQAEAAQRRAAL